MIVDEIEAVFGSDFAQPQFPEAAASGAEPGQRLPEVWVVGSLGCFGEQLDNIQIELPRRVMKGRQVVYEIATVVDFKEDGQGKERVGEKARGIPPDRGYCHPGGESAQNNESLPSETRREGARVVQESGFEERTDDLFQAFAFLRRMTGLPQLHLRGSLIESLDDFVGHFAAQSARGSPKFGTPISWPPSAGSTPN